MSSELSNTAKRPNRKRKTSFLKNARKYGKKGYYGRGSHMEEDTYQYFIRIMEVYREGFETEEDKVNFANNVFEQTENQEINCSCNQVGCRVIETLIPFAGDEVFERFSKAFGEDLRPLCSDRFATHVLEALVRKSFEKLKTKEDVPKIYSEFAIKVSKFLLNNLEDFVWDTYGNHVIRTCLENLAQVPKEDPKELFKDSQVKTEVEIPSEHGELVKEFGERLITWPQFSELCSSELTSGFLQILLKSIKQVDRKLLKRYQIKLLEEIFLPQPCDDPNVLPVAFLGTPTLMLLETCIQLAKSKQFTQIYCKLFTGRLLKLSTMKSTNFAVQKLVGNCKEKDEFEAMFEELSEHFQEIIDVGHYGVVWAIGRSCKRLGTKQGSFVQALMKGLQCAEPEERQLALVMCLSRFKNYETTLGLSNENLQKEKLNLLGTLILQLILEFNKPIKIVNSILNMEPSDLKNLFSNTMGSHIVDSYMTSSFVGEKSREKLVRKLKGYYQDLAATKFGSRSFEAIWKVATLKNKLLIMEELSYKDASWCHTEFGKIIAGKLNLVLFKRNKEEWKSSLNKPTCKAAELFADILK